jgi:hypothetical protein
LSGNILQVSIIPLNELLITGDGPPDWATITFLAIATKFVYIYSKISSIFYGSWYWFLGSGFVLPADQT